MDATRGRGYVTMHPFCTGNNHSPESYLLQMSLLCQNASSHYLPSKKKKKKNVLGDALTLQICLEGKSLHLYSLFAMWLQKDLIEKIPLVALSLQIG